MKKNMKMWLLLSAAFVVGIASPAGASINEIVSVKAEEEDNPQENPADIEGHFGSVPTGDRDQIRVTNEDVEGKSAGVYSDPVNDGALLSIVQDSGPVKVDVEGRQGVGAIYWVTVVPEGEGEGEGEPPVLWADVLDWAGPLRLIDNLTGYYRKYSFDEDEPDKEPEMLYCKSEYYEEEESFKGNITFELFRGYTTGYEYTWSISPGDHGETWPIGGPFKEEEYKIDPGKYTLKVTGPYQLEREIDFAVVNVKLTVDDVLIAGGSEQNDNDERAVVMVNDGFNEENFDSDGNPVPDNEPDAEEGHRIVGDEDPIVSGSAELEGLEDSYVEGTWTLSYGDKIMLWRKVNDEYVQVQNNVPVGAENGGEAELFAGNEPFEFLVEGIKASDSLDDVNLEAEFAPDIEDDVKFEGEGEMTVVRVNLSGDTNRDGIIDGDDQYGKEKWTEERGAIITVNYDRDGDRFDSNGLPIPDSVYIKDGDAEYFDDTIQGQNDTKDIAPIKVLGVGPIPDDWEVILRIPSSADIDRINVYEVIEPGETAVWGRGTDNTENEFEITNIVGNTLEAQTIGIEPLFFPHLPVDGQAGFDGIIEIEVELRDDAGEQRRTDSIELRVAPWLTPSHRDEVKDVYITTATSNYVHNQLDNHVDLTPITSDDIWIQDQIFIGFTSRPGTNGAHWYSVVLNSPRERLWTDLHEEVHEYVLGPGVGLFRPVSPPAPGGTHDGFGNAKTFPSYGQKPWGQIFHGGGMADQLQNFFSNQTEEIVGTEPAEFDVSWLTVGHIDEIVSVEMLDDGEFQVLVASTAVGIELLEDVDPNTELETVWLAEEPNEHATEPYTVEDVLGSWKTYNKSIQNNYLNALVVEIENMGLDVVEVPAFFATNETVEPELPGELAFSLFPNMVNLLYVDGIITLDPMFAPFRDEMEDRVDGHIIWIEDDLEEIQGPSLHNYLGGLHCATNTRRKPHETLKNWWLTLEEE